MKKTLRDDLYNCKRSTNISCEREPQYITHEFVRENALKKKKKLQPRRISDERVVGGSVF